ncbi:MAG: hypothetical protein B7Z10_05610 [Rhodobacterales bacterium 32-66-7]|nr:MAG: hypothetical protein B7Z31_06735 [Rhodobacterales bacterium 12-65-15]OYX25635.1 MAG: hypothetical protein B7Z10_05610 [Rhodobacterales bacterium 32-66-7]
MRAASGAELLLLARCLSRLPVGKRESVATAIIVETQVAADHLRQTGRLHPFGDGSLLARCHQLSPPPEPVTLDREGLHCVILAAEVLLRHSDP